MKKRWWSGYVEEHPFNVWDVEVTEWVWHGIVLARKVFYKKCYGIDSRTEKPHMKWRFAAAPDLSESNECPAGCLRISGLRHGEREI